MLNVISKKFKWRRYIADPQCSKPWVGSSRNPSPTFYMTFWDFRPYAKNNRKKTPKKKVKYQRYTNQQSQSCFQKLSHHLDPLALCIKNSSHTNISQTTNEKFRYPRRSVISIKFQSNFIEITLWHEFFL